VFKSVPKSLDLPALERKILDLWRETGAFARLREKVAGGEPWSFLDGPITANNPMGVHHAWGRTYKDIFQRYHAMMGRDQRFQNGFDCQGLWVEVEVEKDKGFHDKTEIARYGIDRFVRDCKQRVLAFAARQTEQSIRLGMWMDWDDPDTLRVLRDAMAQGAEEVTITAPSGLRVTDAPDRIVGRLGSPEMGGSYFTFSDVNNYTIWAFLKKCHEEGNVYRGTDVMPWCTRCGTGLSQMEVAEGRRLTSHTSVFVRFPLRGREKEALLAWTTTPWTLAANVACAVNPEMTYLRVRHNGWVYYVGKENYEADRVRQLEVRGTVRTEKLQSLRSLFRGSGEVEVLGELRGEELVGLTYDGPYDHLPVQRRPGGTAPGGGRGHVSAEAHRVIPWSEVTGGEGTGIVHIAPGCGAEDHALGVVNDLPVIAPLSENGTYLEGFGEFTGRNVHDVADDVVADLRARGLLFARESYPHVYPHCWRCKQELVFRLVDEWFIRMDWRERITRLLPEVRWMPPEAEAQERDWLINMGDWMISKKRFWGLALPVWVCGECSEFTVVGGRDELREKAVEGWEVFEGHTPHRPWVDAVKIRCDACGGTATRIPDVGNPWLDAGIVPYSTLRHNSDPRYWRRWFPADLVVESFPGQFRNWFYALLAMSAMMEDEAPFRALFGYGLVRDARGQEMHKSQGNSIAFDEAAEVLGAELMRYLYAAQPPTRNLNFPDLADADGAGGGAAEVRRKLLTLWNCYSFFVTYAALDGWRPGPAPRGGEVRNELDRWILSRLQSLVEAAHTGFSELVVHRFMGEYERFVDELSNWYLRRSRRRFWSSGPDADKESAYQTLHTVLVTLARLLAPVLPFLAEEMYQNLVRAVDPAAPVSVHLTDYPVADAELVDRRLEQQVEVVLRAKNLGLALRNEANIRIRQPLSTLTIRPRDAAERDVLTTPHFAAQVLQECNVKALRLIDDESTLLKPRITARLSVLGPRYGRVLNGIRAGLAAADPREVVAALRDGGSYAMDVGETRVELNAGDLDVRYESPEHMVALEDQGMLATLNVQITPELEREGLARDFNRQVQSLRKELGLEVSDRIHVRYAAPERVAHALREHHGWLAGELLAESLGHSGDGLEDGVEVNVGGTPVRVAVAKAPA
jgi:isoleucyl-tRNA synthetase